MAGSEQKASAAVQVAHVLGNLGPGGAEMGVIRLAEALNNHEFKHRILALGSNLSLQQDTGTDIPCYSLGLEGPSYTAFLSLAKALRSFKADLVHVNNLSPWFDAALAARLAGCACIETFHGVEQGNLQFPWPKKMLFKAAARMSNSITAVAAPAADLLADLSGIPRQKIHVIPNGIDTNTFHPAQDLAEKAELRKDLDFPVDALLLGCVAALRPVKNHQGLMHAFSRIANAFPQAYLVLVGQGILEKELKALSQELGFEDKVLFLGPRQDVPRILRALDVFVLNSETEGLSYSVLEAMASGLPVVATDVGGNPGLIEQGKEGFLVPADDHDSMAATLENVLDTPNRLAVLGQNSRSKIVKYFGRDNMVQEYRRLYMSLKNKS